MPYLAGIGPLGPLELVLILAVVIIIFGVGRLPEVGGAIGKGIKEFRRESKSPDDAHSVSKDDTERKA
jgi:sec-independent protein translocase protein TatA